MIDGIRMMHYPLYVYETPVDDENRNADWQKSEAVVSLPIALRHQLSLKALTKTCPHKIRAVLTDNSIQQRCEHTAASVIGKSFMLQVLLRVICIYTSMLIG